MEPTEQANIDLTLTNDPIYRDGITAEELVKQLNSYKETNRYAYGDYFNNIHLHFIDPCYLQGDDTQLQKDFQQSKEETLKKYWINQENNFEDSLLNSVKKMKFSDTQYLALANVYILMRQKGYPKYDPDKPCITR
jgi:hypothetical protein